MQHRAGPTRRALRPAGPGREPPRPWRIRSRKFPRTCSGRSSTTRWATSTRRYRAAPAAASPSRPVPAAGARSDVESRGPTARSPLAWPREGCTAWRRAGLGPAPGGRAGAEGRLRDPGGDRGASAGPWACPDPGGGQSTWVGQLPSSFARCPRSPSSAWRRLPAALRLALPGVPPRGHQPPTPDPRLPLGALGPPFPAGSGQVPVSVLPARSGVPAPARRGCSPARVAATQLSSAHPRSAPFTSEGEFLHVPNWVDCTVSVGNTRSAPSTPAL